MTPSQQHFVQIQGMHRDFNEELPDTQHAYDIRNMRVTSLDEENLLSLVNEKGTLAIDIYDAVAQSKTPMTISGKCIGSCFIANQIVLFVHDKFAAYKDLIYRIYQEEGITKAHLLVHGNLDFNENNPIDCITFFETEDIQKVYWIDRENQLRYINIRDKEKFFSGDTPITLTGTDFKVQQVVNTIPALYGDTNHLVNLAIEKLAGGGYFKSGVIQYVITFSLKNGAESNIVAISPLYYITGTKKGLSPENTSTNSFRIRLSNIYSSQESFGFEYINIYSIHRTSINATAECKLVQQLQIDNTTLNYIDTGVTGSQVNETDLLALYQTPFSAQTFTEKTNTLILGNVAFLKDNKFNDIVWNKYVVDTEVTDVYITDAGFAVDNDSTATPVKKHIVNPADKNNVRPYTFHLDKSSWDVTTYKYLEYYRFGIQLMDSYGTWSVPIWIGDFQNLKHPTNEHFYNNDNATYLPYFKATLTGTAITEFINQYKAVAVRPVVVFPQINDRICKAQGVLNPTVFNWEGRESGNVYAQASWCFRPMAPYDIRYLEDTALSDLQAELKDFRDPDNHVADDTANSIFGLIHPDKYDTNAGDRNLGGWCEFRHNYPLIGDCYTLQKAGIHDFFTDLNRIQYNINDLPSAMAFPIVFFKGSWGYKGTELQHMGRDMPSILLRNNTVYYPQTDNQPIDDEYYKQWFFVDNSIVTLNSPEFEFEDNSYFGNMQDCALRIVGAIPITGNTNALEIIAEGTVNVSQRLEKTTDLSIACNSRLAWRGLYSQPRWFTTANGNTKFLKTIHLWQCQEDLNCSNDSDIAKLQFKYTSSLKFSNNTVFLTDDKIWTDSDKANGSDVFFINEVQNIATPLQTQDDGLILYKGNDESAFLFDTTEEYGIPTASSTDVSFSSNPVAESYNTAKKSNKSLLLTYKSSPHSVIKLKNTSTENHAGQTTLPILKQYYFRFGELQEILCNRPLNYESGALASNIRYFWDNDNTLRRGPISSVIDVQNLDNSNWTLFESRPEWSNGMFCGFLWLGEIYDPIKANRSYRNNRFGGRTFNALKQNQWIIAGPVTELTGQQSLTLQWLEGDTYYQRYDCLKSYPFTNVDVNQNVEILSFMCETHINLDGRYDNRIGMSDNTTARPETFNLLNPVYDQQNTFSSNRIVEGDVDIWKNQIVLSRTKISGEFTDNWTRLNLANALDLNGTKGDISKLINYRDSVYAFQDHAISQIYYNEKEQITTESGLAVQLANSNKLDGYKVLFDKIGCSNKWSVCVTTHAVYFIDDENKSIYMWGGGQEAPINITAKNGFNAWIRKALKENGQWTFDNFITYFNNSTSDVYFVNNDNCLTFNEIVNEFTSFYSYENTPYLQTMNKEFYMFRNEVNGVTMWQQHGGEYNSFFGADKPFSITVLANDKGVYDKIFNTVDFRSNTWSWDRVENKWVNQFATDFKKIEAWTEYQHGLNSLFPRQAALSELKKKYRIWRANIPRNNLDDNIRVQRDRIRNPWAYIKLSSEDDVLAHNKTFLNDVLVNSTIM